MNPRLYPFRLWGLLIVLFALSAAAYLALYCAYRRAAIQEVPIAPRAPLRP